MASSAYQFCNYFNSRQPIFIGRTALFILLISLHRILKRYELKGQYLTKLIMFIVSVSLFLNCYSLSCEHAAAKNTRVLVHFGATALIHTKVPAILLSDVFASSVQMPAQWKKRIKS